MMEALRRPKTPELIIRTYFFMTETAVASYKTNATFKSGTVTGKMNL